MPNYPEPIRIGTMYPPQVLNPAANNGAGAWEILTGSDGAYKAQSIQLVVEDSFSGSGNITKLFDEEMHGIVVSNDYSADLTLTVHGKARIVKAGEVYEGRFKPFGSVVITASGPWRAEALQQTGVASAVVTPPEEDTTAPDNVTGFDFNAVTQGSVELVWNASASSDTTGYEVWRGGSLLTTIPGTTYTATGLSASTQYTFTIKARDAAGNIASGTSINVTTAAQPGDTTPPDNVTGLAASNITETGLTLTWLASPSSDLKDYRVYQGSTLIATVTALTHDVSGLTADTSYTFTVKARDNANNEASGASVSVTTDAGDPPIENQPVTDGRTLFLENPANNTTIPNPENYFSGTGDFTLAVTAKVAVTGGNAASLLLSRLGTNSENVMKLEFTWNNLFTSVLYGTKGDGTTAWNPSLSTSPTAYTDYGPYYHVVVQREGTSFRLYVNNSLLQNLTIAATDIVREVSQQPLVIGQSGKLATFKNVSYYNRALTAEERTQNYNALK